MAKYTLTPDQLEAVDVLSSIWAQIHERFNGTWQEFLALHDNVTAYYGAYYMGQVVDAHARGWREGTSHQKRLMQYEAAAGICWERRRVCAERGEPVPDWVLEAEAEIEAHFRQMDAEDNEVRAQVLLAQAQIPPGEPVH